jgi:hypothetical protein
LAFPFSLGALIISYLLEMLSSRNVCSLYLQLEEGRSVKKPGTIS